MTPALKLESENLARSWMGHDPAWLRDYLVAGVEDPRINVQSILTRHFLLDALGPEGCRPLMEQECRFASAMNWLLRLAARAGEGDELGQVLHALRKGGDNAEGIEVPAFMLRTFARLPMAICGLAIPNYIEAFLCGAQTGQGQEALRQPCMDTFRELWAAALAGRGSAAGQALTVLEPACGSANDYRFLEAFGIARLIQYQGFDLCPGNIENARALFPGVAFELGNVFDIAAPDKSFDLCFLHDLFEHLSPAGLEVAVRQACRVTRQGLCVGFFNMDEIPAHHVRPVRQYYWNTLSMAAMKALFAECGFIARAMHIGSFLRQQTGCDQTHNPKAYTFFLAGAG